MSESLLPYYNRELRAIRKLAGEFADAYPKVAARLRVTAEAAAAKEAAAAAGKDA